MWIFSLSLPLNCLLSNIFPLVPDISSTDTKHFLVAILRAEQTNFSLSYYFTMTSTHFLHFLVCPPSKIFSSSTSSQFPALEIRFFSCLPPFQISKNRLFFFWQTGKLVISFDILIWGGVVGKVPSRAQGPEETTCGGTRTF